MKTQKESNGKKMIPLTIAEKKRAVPVQKVVVSPTSEERDRMIAEAAYLLAEQRGFQGGSAQDDWLQAEKTVEAQILGK